MTTHQVKCIQPYFDQTVRGVKTFEYRKDDRGYEVGDHLILKEYCQNFDSYSGKQIRALVQDIWRNIPGMPTGYCIMKIKLMNHWEG